MVASQRLPSLWSRAEDLALPEVPGAHLACRIHPPKFSKGSCLPSWFLAFPWDREKDPVLALGASGRTLPALSSVSVPAKDRESRAHASVFSCTEQGAWRGLLLRSSSPAPRQHLTHGRDGFSLGLCAVLGWVLCLSLGCWVLCAVLGAMLSALPGAVPGAIPGGALHQPGLLLAPGPWGFACG